jgi:hypothetical protein
MDGKAVNVHENGTASAVPIVLLAPGLRRLAFVHILFGLFICLLGLCFGIGRRLQIVDGFAQALGRRASHLCLELVEGNAEIVRDVNGSNELAEVLKPTRCLLQVSARWQAPDALLLGSPWPWLIEPIA